MSKKTRIAGGICLLAALVFLAVPACAPATPMPVPGDTPTIRQEDQQPPTRGPTAQPTALQAVLAVEDVPASPVSTLPPKPTTTFEAIATARRALALGDFHTVEQGGFSFRPLIGFDLHLKPDQATLVSQDGRIILTMSGVDVQQVGSLEDRLGQLLSGVSDGMENFQAGSPYAVSVDQKAGLATDISGMLGGEKIAGQIMLVAQSETQLFYAIALFAEGPGDEQDLAQDNQAIEAVIDSVTFVDSDLQ